jgi:uncharacterized protein YqeY
MSLKTRIQHDMQQAMRGGDKSLLATLRLALAAIKQREVDSRTELDDAAVEAVIGKMIKQGRDAAAQFSAAGREDLAAKENTEVAVLVQYLPEQLDERELAALVRETIAETGARSLSDLGEVMRAIKSKTAGRADLSHVSRLVRRALEGHTEEASGS